MSILKEKEAIDYTMNALGFHANRRSDVKGFVETRDKCAHASGFIQYDNQKVKTHFLEVLDYVKQIFDKTKNNVRKVFIFALHNYWDSDRYDSYLSVEQTAKIIKQLGCSPAEILYVLETDKKEMLDGHKESTYQLSYIIIKIVLKKYLQNNFEYAIEDIDEDLELNQLLDFLKSLPPSDYMEIEIELEDELAAVNEFYNLEKYQEILDEIRLIEKTVDSKLRIV